MPLPAPSLCPRRRARPMRPDKRREAAPFELLPAHELAELSAVLGCSLSRSHCGGRRFPNRRAPIRGRELVAPCLDPAGCPLDSHALAAPTACLCEFVFASKKVAAATTAKSMDREGSKKRRQTSPLLLLQQQVACSVLSGDWGRRASWEMFASLTIGSHLKRCLFHW